MGDYKPQFSGPGPFTLFGLLFVTLKLCGVIDWPWLWVTAPLWIGAGLLVFILLPIIILAAWLDSKNE